jgi:hypothetical protein
MERGAGQVERGKPMTFFVQGEYGIGKSSLARYVQWMAEKKNGLIGLYATLGPAKNVDEVGSAILKAAVESGSMEPARSETIRDWLAKYVGEQSLFGLTIHAAALQKEGPNIAKGTLPFLRQILDRVKDSGVKGLFLVFDEINGIAGNPEFAHFVKGLVDMNALSSAPLPILLMLCGTRERRGQMIACHQPVERIFDVVDIEPLNRDEMNTFFTRAFETVGIRVEAKALDLMAHYSAGFPKIMHLVGDNAYWLDRDSVISKDDAFAAVLNAADEVGKKYVDQQVYRALQSKDYQSILAKLGATAPKDTFARKDIERGLTETQKKKLSNFLQRMKKLNVLRSGETRGEYVFIMRMVQIYIWLQEVRKTRR